MALVKCIKCKQDISEKATQCPKCQCAEPFAKKSNCIECNSEISISSKTCPECGYPNPLEKIEKQEIKEYNEKIEPTEEELKSALKSEKGCFNSLIIFAIFLVIGIIFAIMNDDVGIGQGIMLGTAGTFILTTILKVFGFNVVGRFG